MRILTLLIILISISCVSQQPNLQQQTSGRARTRHPHAELRQDYQRFVLEQQAIYTEKKKAFRASIECEPPVTSEEVDAYRECKQGRDEQMTAYPIFRSPSFEEWLSTK